MSTGSKRRESLWRDDPPPTLAWRSWPLGEHAVGTSLAVAALAAVGIGVHLLTSKIHLAVLAVAVLAAAMWRYFVPIHFELNPDGVDQWVFGRARRIPWTAIHRYEIRPSGVLLLPFSDRSAMDPFRGLYLPWGDRREEVLFQVRFYLDRSH